MSKDKLDGPAVEPEVQQTERQQIKEDYKNTLKSSIQVYWGILISAEHYILGEAMNERLRVEKGELSLDDAVHKLKVTKLTQVAGTMTDLMMNLDLLNDIHVERKRKRVDTKAEYTGRIALPIRIHPAYRGAYDMYIQAYIRFSRARSEGLDEMVLDLISGDVLALTNPQAFVDELAKDEFEFLLEAMAELLMVVEELCEEIYPQSTPTQ